MSKTEATAPKGGRPFGAFRFRSYRLFWFHNVILNIGEYVGRVATGWFVFQLTNSPFLLGAVRTTLSFPMLFLSVLAGVVADKVDRRSLVLVYIAIGSTNFLIFALLIAFGLSKIWPIFAFTLISGIVAGAYFPTRRAILPMLVGREDLINAVSLGNLTPQLGATIGGGLAGWILASWGIASGFFIAGLGWGGGFILMLFVSIPTIATIRAKSNTWADLVEGLKYIKEDSLVTTLMLFALVPSLFGRFYEPLLPVFSRDILNSGAEGLGWLTAISGLGYAASSLILSALGDFRRKGWALVLAGLFVGAISIIFAFSRWYIPSLLLAFGLGATAGLNSTLSLSLLQLRVPEYLRGRVTGVWVLTMPGTMPVSPFMAGILADRFGAPWAVASGGMVLILLILLMTLLIPNIRRLD